MSLEELIFALTGKEVESFKFKTQSLFPLKDKYIVAMAEVDKIVEAVRNNDSFAIERLLEEVNKVQIRANETQNRSYRQRHTAFELRPYSLLIELL